MNDTLPGLVVTGASGFIGRHFVLDAMGNFRLFCIARRGQQEVGVPFHENIHWLQADITKWKNLLMAAEYIKNYGSADYVLHLAGYYDFTLKESDAYEQINVMGTRHLLEMSRLLEIKRFVFSSSLAACKFPPNGKTLTEKSPADANHPYARSKSKAEAIIKQYSNTVPSSIVRLAAVYSDWCEYPLLYMLLRYWLSKNRLLSKILAGSGESAVPYIHVQDLVKLFVRIFEISDILPKLAVYNASPQGSVSHIELYKTATRYYYGYDIKPFLMPKFLSALGLIIMSYLNRLNGKEPLEQLWMWRYIDKKLSVDASATYEALGWKPTPRYHILRRLLFLTEKMINHPHKWTFRNETYLERVAYRKSIKIYDVLTELRDDLVEKVAEEVMKLENEQRFPNYRRMSQELLKWHIAFKYQLIASAVRSRDRSMIPEYVQIIAHRRFAEGFNVKEVKGLMFLTGETMKESLLTRPELKGAEKRVDDYIILTTQFSTDELEDTFDMLQLKNTEKISQGETVESLTYSETLKQIVLQLEDIGTSTSLNRLKGVVTYKNYGVLITLESHDE